MLRISDGVLLTGSAIDTALYAIEVAQRARARNGLPQSRSLAALRDALAARGQGDASREAEVDSGVMEQVVMVTTQEAARLLGCSQREARRKAPKLGGSLAGGRWLLDRQAVIEHIEGKAS